MFFFLPWLIKLAPDLTGWTRYKAVFPAIKELIQEYIVEHKKTFQKDNLRDYMDAFMLEQSQTTDPRSSFYKKAGGM